MRAVVDADGEAVDELTAEPPGDERDSDGEGADDDGDGSGRAGSGAPEPPAHRKESDHNYVTGAVKQSDPLCTRSGRDGKKIDEAENCSGETGHDARGNHVVGRLQQRRPAGGQSDEVEEQRHPEYAKRKGDQHLIG